jgi:hypothetical protein
MALQEAVPHEGTIVIDKKVTIATAVTMIGLIAAAGFGYAMLLADVSQLKAASARDVPKLAEIHDRTGRMETDIAWIRATIMQGLPIRPRP